MKIIKFSNEIINANNIVRMVKDNDSAKQKDCSICIHFSPSFKIFYDFATEQDRDTIFENLTNFLFSDQDQFLNLETYEVIKRIRNK